MQLTIVKPDNLVIKDSVPLKFDFEAFSLPNDFWSLQWQETVGHIEFEDQSTVNEEISELPDWTTPIIAEFDRIISELNNQMNENVKLDQIMRNGMSRKQRELNYLADSDPQAALKKLIAQRV